MLRLLCQSALVLEPRIEDILLDEDILVQTGRPDELFILQMFLWMIADLDDYS